MIWHKIKGPETPFRYVCEESYEHDVQCRIPATEKARRVLGYEATTTLDEMLDEVIPWVEKAIANGTL
jgi:nucleoside-diphosphate-sugar epimerase